MPTYDKDGHLYGDAYFNADYFHVGNEAAEKTYINMENEQLEIHNLVEPTEDNDAATKKYVDDNAGGGGSGGDVVKIAYDDTTMSAEDLGVAVKAVLDAGKVPLIDWLGELYGCNTYYEEAGAIQMCFTCTYANFADAHAASPAVSALSCGVLEVGYSRATPEDPFTWYVATGYADITLS